MEHSEIARALATAAGAGPFFVLETDPPPVTVADGAPPWRSFADLTDDPAVTRARVDAIRAGIAERGGLDLEAVPPRAAASLAHLGLVARLVSPPLAAALLGGVVPDLDGPLYWRDVLGPVPLTLPRPGGSALDRDDVPAVAVALAELMTRGPVARLGAAIGEVGGVSAQILWGNVASATAGAVKMLAVAAPERAATAYAVGAALIARAPLTGTGAFSSDLPSAAFRRTSCCLYYQVPGGGYCGDCVLAARQRP